MPGPFQGINTMSSALRAFQRALDVTGHNISNVNTTGYSRQSVQFNQADPSHITGINNYFVGNGVSAASISRIQDQFLFMRQVDASSERGRLGSLSDGLNGVQSVMNEPGGASIGDALDRLYNAWSALGSNPNDTVLRQQVQQAGATLSSRVRGMYSNLQSQSAQVDAQIGGSIQQAQNLLQTIANMNQQIRSEQASGGDANDILDARDEAIQALSQIMPVTVQAQQDGTVMLFSGQMTLVDSEGAATIPTTYDAVAGTLTNGSVTYPVRSGSLAGLFQTSQNIKTYQGKLDTLANSMRTQFNSIHATGTTALGATGQNFFNDNIPQSGAIDFDLDVAIKADVRNIATGVSGNPGDGGLALSMSALRDVQIAGLGGKTMGSYFSDLVSGVGQDAATAESYAATSEAIMTQIGQQIQSVSGVSIDDEMANMLRFQRSYQAAAKALSVFDQTTEDLLSMIR
jgi:flagellar hook-associated protein 1 FlgK